MRIVWNKMAVQEFRERTEEMCMIEEEEEQGGRRQMDKN